MHPAFKTAKFKWWWIGSAKLLCEFEGDPFAQAYEVMRRMERFESELFFYVRNGQTWRQLPVADRHLFVMTYKKWLERLGWCKTITVGPGGISFDCSRSSHFLLEALTRELAHPTAMMAGFSLKMVRSGTSDVRQAIESTRGAIPRFSSHDSGNKPYTSQSGSWSFSAQARKMVYLRFPLQTKFGENRTISDREAMAYFRSFIKDAPPADFDAHRKQFQRPEQVSRMPHSRTISMGIMALDVSDLPKPESDLKALALWFGRPQSRKNGKTIFSHSITKLTKDLFNGKASIDRLMLDAVALK
ncbi:MAG: hypothetical protein JWR26_270 [Pedosphaera sp.]|nr:hypothetical protein [Pedosphaera sp.]